MLTKARRGLIVVGIYYFIKNIQLNKGDADTLRNDIVWKEWID